MIEIQRQYEDEFDTGYQSKWNTLLENAKKILKPSDLEKFPLSASQNFEHWMSLYQLMPDSYYQQEHEELSTQDDQWRIFNNPENQSDDDPIVDLSS